MDYKETFPAGPLDEYRKKATFDWRKMKILIKDKDLIELEENVWKIMKTNPLYARTQNENDLVNYRKITLQRYRHILQDDYLAKEYFQNFFMRTHLLLCIGMFDNSLSIKLAVANSIFYGVIELTGTERHRYLLHQLERSEISGSFALTELSHGSDSQRMETRATYDPKIQEFILHSPRIESMKVWIGNLGQTATHVLIFAQLYTPDNVCHGLHIFVVPIRNPKTLVPYPGITVGDMGHKIGLNGLDNGFILFNQYRIPRENLLNRHADVTVEGKYISSIKDSKTGMGTLFGSLSAGRVAISNICAKNLQKCMAIAIRYSAVRKQFGLTHEIPILEYQIQQCRLFPFLAATYILSYFARTFLNDYFELVVSFMLNKKNAEIINQVMEYHALSCGIKVLSGWIARDGIQESREACGGHGYLNASGFGVLRNDNDANCTYEGDNNVLLQQVSNYLLNIKKKKDTEGFKPPPSSTINFLNRYEIILKEKLNVQKVDDLINMEVILQIYSWLLSKLLERSSKKFNSYLSQEKSTFYARNNSQIYYCHSLSKVYIEHSMLESFHKFIKSIDDDSISRILQKLGCLYGLWRLQNYIGILYEEEYCSRIFSSMVEESILKLCADIKDNAVALADALAPPDFILNSVLGKSDGQIYKNIYYELMDTQKNPDFSIKPEYVLMNSKI